ncbi:MAG: MBL fold metallo-hydrolase [Ruminococcus sp.]|nr:MBL fold metallo-hydrolase [Ruminococcus sp.]
MRITVLLENVSDNPVLKAEHGLSLYIETQSHKLLFDMGQSELFYENSQKLDVDLSDVDIAVLSHGHYDHGGGLSKFLEINSKAKVYLNKHAFEPHYNGEKYIGLDVTLKDSDRLVFVTDEFKIDDSLTLFDCNKESANWIINSGGLSVVENGTKTADKFLHEQYLMIEENNKKVLISGCSHKGILNISDFFDADVVVGGFHTSKWERADVELLAQTLCKSNTAYYTCHCTGYEQYEFMKQYADNIRYLSTGFEIVL